MKSRRIQRHRQCEKRHSQIVASLAMEKLEPRTLLSAYTFSTVATLGSTASTFGDAEHNLVLDAAGDIFGVVSTGPLQQGGSSAPGGIFEIPAHTSTPIFRASFAPTVIPSDITIDSSGNVYGFADAIGSGLATPDVYAYELPAGGSALETIADLGNDSLPQFAGAPLVDADGNVYGTTTNGGTSHEGEIFEIKKGSGTATTLASFPNLGSDGFPAGEKPNEGLLMDSGGDLIGSTSGGGTFGSGNGSIFELAPNSSNIVTLCSFNGTTTGSAPASIVMDSHGNIYGDLMNNNSYNDTTLGAIFELPAGASTPTILAPFTAATGVNSYFPITIDSAGDLFGVSHFGGDDLNNGFDGLGVVFELPAGTNALVPLHTFADGTDGFSPQGTVTLDSSGNLYGATNGYAMFSSLIYKLTPGGNPGGGGGGSLSGSLGGPLPAVAQVAGTRTSINQKLVVTDSSAAVSGHVGISFFLSTDGAVDANSIALPHSISRQIKLKPGQHLLVPYHVSAIPAGAAPGSYQIIAQITGPDGTTSDAASSSFMIEPAQIDFSGAFVKAAPASIKAGKNVAITFSVTNNGDVTAVGNLPIQLDLSATDMDDQGLSLAPMMRHIALRAGKTIKMTVHEKATGIADGSYFIFIKLDPGNTLGDVNAANNNFESAAPLLTVTG